MMLANQETGAPTHKLLIGVVTAGTIGAAFSEAWVAGLGAQYPFLAGPEMAQLIEVAINILAGLAVGWLVQDRVNIPDVPMPISDN